MKRLYVMGPYTLIIRPYTGATSFGLIRNVDHSPHTFLLMNFFYGTADEGKEGPVPQAALRIDYASGSDSISARILPEACRSMSPK